MAEKSADEVMRMLADKFMQLYLNGASRPGDGAVKPVLKFCTLDESAVWLLTEIDPLNPDRAWGLCDPGLGSPEIGFVDLGELGRIWESGGPPVAIDLTFEADKSLSEYADEANRLGRIKT